MAEYLTLRLMLANRNLNTSNITSSERPSQRTVSSTPTPHAYQLDDLPAAPPPAYDPRAAPRFGRMQRASRTSLSKIVDPPCYFAVASSPAPLARGNVGNASAKADFEREEKVRKLFERHSLSGVAWEDFQAVARLESRWERRAAVDVLKRGGSVSDVDYPAWMTVQKRKLRNKICGWLAVIITILVTIKVLTIPVENERSGDSSTTTSSVVSAATGVSDQSYAITSRRKRAPYTGMSESWITLYEPRTATTAATDNMPRTLVTVTVSPTGRSSS